MPNSKTNAMRILDKENIEYNSYSYDYDDGAIDGITVAKKIGKSTKKVYKTLVTQGSSNEYYVFLIPVSHELDLKSAAKIVGEKSVKMVKASDVRKLTGYVPGGCSPIGMKKNYKTIVDSSIYNLDKIIVSGGKIGYQIELNPKALINLIKAEVGEIVL